MAGAKSLVVLCILLIIATSQAAPCKLSICYRLCRSAGGSKTFCAKKCHCTGLLSTFVSNELKMEDYNCDGAVLEKMMMMMMDDDYNHAEAVLEEMSMEELISLNDKLTTMSKCKYNPCYRACRALGGSKVFCAKKCHCSLPAFFPNELATTEAILEEEMMMMREEHGLVDKLTASSAAASFASIRKQHAPTITYPVDFQLMLNVDELTATSYQNFITDLRSNLAKGAQYLGKVPILPSYGKNPPHLFDVVLKQDNREVTVRVRHDNLYVRGYLMITPNQWMEFNVDGLHMVDPKSKFLDFGDRYSQMESAANVTVTNILYTKVSLSDVVLKLSKSKEKKEQARSLIFMAQMISEAARFPDVSSFFGIHLVNGEHLPIWMRTMQNDWGKFSKVVQCYDKYKKKYKYKEVTINGVVYKTADQLRGIFGVMLKEPHLDENTCGIKKLANKDEL